MGRKALTKQSSDQVNGGRATRPGPRIAALAVAMGSVAALAAGCGSTSHQVAAKVNPDRVVKGIGTIPSWLPVAKTASHQVVSATTAKPVTSASQGDTVRALYDGAITDITAQGPYVPYSAVVAGAHGKIPAAGVVPVHYEVTLKDAKGTLSLKKQVFEIVLPTGEAVEPAVTPVGRRAIPSSLRAGQSLTLRVAAKLPDGNGVIRWTPAGRKALVTWTYQLELD